MFAALIEIPRIPTLRPFGIPIQPFGLLVGTGIIIGYWLARRRCRVMGLDEDLCADGMVWTLVTAFVTAHLVSVVFYFPDRIREDPLVLLYFWSGLSSFGGFIGAFAGAWWFFKRKHDVSLIQYADAIIFGFVPGWVFGRLGCTVVRDHPGKATDFFLAVNYPTGLRHDLGFYEMLFTVTLTGLLYALRNVRPFPGFHPALVMLLYAPVRFAFDFLRTADKTYAGLTPGQYLAIAMVGCALALAAYGMRNRDRLRVVQPAGDAA